MLSERVEVSLEHNVSIRETGGDAEEAHQRVECWEHGVHGGGGRGSASSAEA